MRSIRFCNIYTLCQIIIEMVLVIKLHILKTPCEYFLNKGKMTAMYEDLVYAMTDISHHTNGIPLCKPIKLSEIIQI